MMYYFVSDDGELASEENYKGYFEINNTDTFSNRRKAVVAARKRINARITELKEYAKLIGKEAQG